MKNVKRNVIVSAFMAIALCMIIVAGATFALFTSNSSVNIAVTSGNVEVVATASGLKVYSPTAVSETEIVDDKNAVDEDGGKFVNGGTATLSDDTVTLTDMTPGDKVTFEIAVENKSTVAVKYRTVIEAKDEGLLAALKIKIAGKSTVGATAWKELAANTAIEGVEKACEIELPVTAGKEFINKKCVLTFKVEAVQGNAVVDKHYDTLEAAFGLDSNTFSAATNRTEALVLDGNNNTYIDKWVDDYATFDLTIKNVIFTNGANFNVKKNDVSVTLENCTFYACNQDKAAADLGITDKTTGAGNGSRNNIMTNSGAGMCLNIELMLGTTGAKLNVTGCTFIGENDETLPVYGDKYDGAGKVTDSYKKRGHAFALNAISGGGKCGVLGSLVIDNCVMGGVRGNAIQLYPKGGDIVIKNTKINSWGVNNGKPYVVGTSTKDSSAAAIRGEMDDANGRTLTIENVYFGLDETTGGTHNLTHVEVNDFGGNTDGTRPAGKY